MTAPRQARSLGQLEVDDVRRPPRISPGDSAPIEHTPEVGLGHLHAADLAGLRPVHLLDEGDVTVPTAGCVAVPLGDGSHRRRVVHLETDRLGVLSPLVGTAKPQVGNLDVTHDDLGVGAEIGAVDARVGTGVAGAAVAVIAVVRVSGPNAAAVTVAEDGSRCGRGGRGQTGHGDHRRCHSTNQGSLMCRGRHSQ